MKPYRTDEFVHKLFYETSRFTAFNNQWVVTARINNSQRDPTQSSERDMTYQVRKWNMCTRFNVTRHNSKLIDLLSTVDSEDENHLSVVSTLFNLERTIWWHEGSAENSQIWFYRTGQWKSVLTSSTTWHDRVQQTSCCEGHKFSVIRFQFA